jgi:hypothetical protein
LFYRSGIPPRYPSREGWIGSVHSVCESPRRSSEEGCPPKSIFCETQPCTAVYDPAWDELEIAHQQRHFVGEQLISEDSQYKSVGEQVALLYYKSCSPTRW